MNLKLSLFFFWVLLCTHKSIGGLFFFYSLAVRASNQHCAAMGWSPLANSKCQKPTRKNVKQSTSITWCGALQVPVPMNNLLTTCSPGHVWSSDCTLTCSTFTRVSTLVVLVPFQPQVPLYFLTCCSCREPSLRHEREKDLENWKSNFGNSEMTQNHLERLLDRAIGQGH